VTRERANVMSLCLYQSREEARSVPWGRIELRVCPESGLIFNAAFDSDLVLYDPTYDSTVPSPVSHSYCNDLAAFLKRHFSLKAGSTVVEAGCGKGQFLRLLCDSVPGLRGVGMDPSCPQEIDDGQIQLIQDYFRPDKVPQAVSLVFCRHAMDQILNPLNFLREISAYASAQADCGVFIEVRDFEAIMSSNSFWDLSYETHCFFTEASLAHLFGLAGFAVSAVGRGLDGQYLWLGGRPDSKVSAMTRADIAGLSDRLRAYGERERSMIESTRAELAALKAAGRTTVVWGAATKGVNYLTAVDPDARLVDIAADLNPLRYQTFVASSGHEVIAPSQLLSRVGPTPAIIIMNPAYNAEIAQMCADLGLAPLLLDAHCRPVVIS
jgi:hypothetical protein